MTSVYNSVMKTGAVCNFAYIAGIISPAQTFKCTVIDIPVYLIITEIFLPYSHFKYRNHLPGYFWGKYMPLWS